MKYRDFNIRILGKRDDGYDISVESPAGSDKTHVRLDIEDVTSRIHALGGTIRSRTTRDLEFEAADSATPAQIGTELYEALFSGGVRTMYDRSVGEVLHDSESGLRIKLHVALDDPEVGALANLPWEFMYEAGSQDFLALSRQTPIVRYIEVPRRLRAHALGGKLRILVVMSSPNGHTQLDLARERKLIEDSWAVDDDVEVDFLEHPTKARLFDVLVEKQYHVLHYMGHGAYDVTSGNGALVLEDSHGNADLLDARTFGMWLRDAPKLRLILLNACDTGKADEQEPFAGVANRLVMVGLPAVVAMQFPISDEAAIEFARVFYSRLVDGFPVDEATTQGRKAILTTETGALEWATPVLYMRAPDGQLFDAAEIPVVEDDTAVAPESRSASQVDPETTIAASSIFLALTLVGLSVFSAYRIARFDDSALLISLSCAIAVVAVACCTVFCLVRCRDTLEPRYHALLTFNVINLGIHAALITGSIAYSFFRPEFTNYNLTVSVGSVILVVFAVLLASQLRGSAWVYATAPLLAILVILGHLVSMSIELGTAGSSGGAFWTTDLEAFARLLDVTAGISGIAVSLAFLISNRKFENPPPRPL